MDKNNNINNSSTSSNSFLIPISSSNLLPTSTEIEKGQSIGIIPTGVENLAMFDQNFGSTNKKLEGISPQAMKYFKLVENLTPNEMLLKFARNAPKNVQEAAKSTVMNIIGSLPNYALDATLLTTNSKLANLLYQMQITGYMFKNAEYRMSLTRMLKGLPRLPAATQIIKGNVTVNPLAEGNFMQGEAMITTAKGDTISVNAQELADALSKEVQELRAELAIIKNERENELKSNLLTYIQALPEKDLKKLTSDMSEEILQSIKLLVDAMMERLGVNPEGPEVLIQQNIGYLAQLCMWQMVVGYKLRELEALEKGVPID
eukprot:gene9844-13242_t